MSIKTYETFIASDSIDFLSGAFIDLLSKNIPQPQEQEDEPDERKKRKEGKA